jgi:hypothetical protein
LLLTISRKAPIPLRAEHPAVFSIRTLRNMQENDKTLEIEPYLLVVRIFCQTEYRSTGCACVEKYAASVKLNYQRSNLSKDSFVLSAPSMMMFFPDFTRPTIWERKTA